MCGEAGALGSVRAVARPCPPFCASAARASRHAVNAAPATLKFINRIRYTLLKQKVLKTSRPKETQIAEIVSRRPKIRETVNLSFAHRRPFYKKRPKFVTSRRIRSMSWLSEGTKRRQK